MSRFNRALVINGGNNKLHAQKTLCSMGHLHDSKKEALRCAELHLLQSAGKISGLELQKPYEIIPAIYKTATLKETYQKGEKKGQCKTKRVCEEKAVVYKADFVYFDHALNKTVIEDSKGMRTKDYILKRKLMKHQYCQNDDTVFIET